MSIEVGKLELIKPTPLQIQIEAVVTNGVGFDSYHFPRQPEDALSVHTHLGRLDSKKSLGLAAKKDLGLMESLQELNDFIALGFWTPIGRKTPYQFGTVEELMRFVEGMREDKGSLWATSNPKLLTLNEGERGKGLLYRAKDGTYHDTWEGLQEANRRYRQYMFGATQKSPKFEIQKLIDKFKHKPKSPLI